VTGALVTLGGVTWDPNQHVPSWLLKSILLQLGVFTQPVWQVLEVYWFGKPCCVSPGEFTPTYGCQLYVQPVARNENYIRWAFFIKNLNKFKKRHTGEQWCLLIFFVIKIGLLYTAHFVQSSLTFDGILSILHNKRDLNIVIIKQAISYPYFAD